MSLRKYFASVQFQWSAYQGFLAYLFAAIPTFAGWATGSISDKTAYYALIILIVPFVKRMQEGVADAMRAVEKKVLKRDVKGPE